MIVQWAQNIADDQPSFRCTLPNKGTLFVWEIGKGEWQFTLVGAHEPPCRGCLVGADEERAKAVALATAALLAR